MAPKIQTTTPTTQPRLLSQNLIDLLTSCTNKKPEGKVLFCGPRVREGVMEKKCFIKDVKFPYTRWHLFQHCFRNRNLGIPLYNPWRLDMGKLVVTNICMDVDFLKDITSWYDLVSRVVKTFDRKVMVKITKQ